MSNELFCYYELLVYIYIDRLTSTSYLIYIYIFFYFTAYTAAQI